MAIILDGNVTSAAIRADIARQTADLKSAGGKTPHLAAILVGDDPASKAYVSNKVKDCHEVGFASTLRTLPADVSESQLLGEVAAINGDPDVDGLIVQLPLPAHIEARKVTEAILPGKDVDGFHPVNVGRMAKNLPCFISATPLGILQLIEHYKIETSGRHCVVIGRSEIVGSPVSILLSRKTYPGDCTVTLCHSRTRDIGAFTRQADIIIAALGKPGFLKADMVRDGAIVIDVGISRVEDPSRKSGYALRGDVDFEGVAPHCSYITPVPGGVGPMTRAALLWNTLQACRGDIYKT
jgi:methylenetetrahydrofolate dehydrogenase (NADP+) / methenyltetrahydrofolate cyclohydrolase